MRAFEVMNLLTRRSHRHVKALFFFCRLNHSNLTQSLKRETPQSSYGRYVLPKIISIYDWNVQITNLGRHQKVEQARKLFEEMPERDVVSYASMITVYLKNGDLPNAEKVFNRMPGSSIMADSAMINGYAKAHRMEEARRLFDQMPQRNVVSWTSLISGYMGVGQIDEARRLFNQMPEKNLFSWTVMLTGYARNGLISDAKEVFYQMPERNVVAWTAMIKSLVENREIDEARKLFNQMPSRNLYSWNIMISGYIDKNRLEEAIQLFKSMPERSEVSWTIMFTGLARNGMTENARECFDQMPKKDIAAWNAMITVYTDDGLMTKASELFNLMPERNVVSWNAMIDGYSRNGPEQETLKHLISMFRAGDRPNGTTITSVTAACESRVELVQVHALVVLLGFESETSLSNALINRYSRSGDIACACDVFKNLKLKDVVSWTAMILAYSNHGYGQHSLQVFARMLRSGTKPDSITFVGVLSACSHAGLLEKGRKLFDSMSREYGLEQRQEHYSCLVDLLGRLGLISEAVEMVNQMPASERDGVVLGALLGACKLHGNVEVANQVGAELIEMEPSGSGGYMLLANLYAARGKWDDYASVRKRMKEMKVKKVAGFSQIDVKNKSYLFFAGDRSHPHMDEIYDMLKEKLLIQMKELSYSYRNPYLIV